MQKSNLSTRMFTLALTAMVSTAFVLATPTVAAQDNDSGYPDACYGFTEQDCCENLQAKELDGTVLTPEEQDFLARNCGSVGRTLACIPPPCAVHFGQTISDILRDIEDLLNSLGVTALKWDLRGFDTDYGAARIMTSAGELTYYRYSFNQAGLETAMGLREGALSGLTLEQQHTPSYIARVAHAKADSSNKHLTLEAVKCSNRSGSESAEQCALNAMNGSMYMECSSDYDQSVGRGGMYCTHQNPADGFAFRAARLA